MYAPISLSRTQRSAASVGLALAAFAGCSVDDRDVGLGELSPDAGGASGSGGSGASGAAGSATGVGGSRGAGASPDSGAFPPPGGSAGGPDDSDAGAEAGRPDSPPLPACADLAAPGEGVASATTTPGDGRFSLSCGQGLSNDVSFHWVAPGSDYYRFHTEGSSYDTALALVSAACDDTELDCNDDGPVAPASEIVREFARGEEVVVVVDGKSGGSGDTRLEISRVTCPAIDLSEQPLPLTASTLDGSDVHDGDCGGAARREKTYRWAAPSDGLYRFSVSSADIDPALYVEAGPICGGELLGCNAGTPQLDPAQVTRRLSAGEEVTLIVDSQQGAGNFQLAVQPLVADCPGRGELDQFSEVSGLLTPGDASVLSGSCLPASITNLPGGTVELPEHSYAVTVTAGLRCSFIATADGPVALYVLSGLDCGGAEQACVTSTDNGGGDQEALVQLGDLFSSESSEHVLVVESATPFSSVSYSLFVICVII